MEHWIADSKRGNDNGEYILASMINHEKKKVYLHDALFTIDCRIFEVVEPSLPEQDYLDWGLIPLEGNTLAKENTLSGLAEGHFVLEGIVVHKTGELEKGYLDISLPERDMGSYFVKLGGEIIKGLAPLVGDSQMIPAVAIEKFGVYEQYYAKGHAEVGLAILREGLKAATTKWPIALDIGYICRDEKRYPEAIDAFTLAINEGTIIQHYAYAERADLYTKIGNLDASERDWEMVLRIAGPDVVRNLRGL